MSEYNLSYTASEINTKLRKIDILDANKLDASELPSAINTALDQAKAEMIDAVIAALPVYNGEVKAV